jgi:DNA helicase-2/ATP-dependent DNA helicase PcrA
MTYSAQDIADATFAWSQELDRRAGVRSEAKPRVELTAEQRDIVASDPSTTTLVTAGAGSGKTETMTMRVLWLVANGHARLDEILGLTFTRRAATSLAARVRFGLDALAWRDMIPGDHGDDSAAALFSASMTTYNSFANRIFSEFAHLVGVDGSAAVMTEATAWQLARRAVLESSGTDLAELDMTLNSVIEVTLSLARALTDNMIGPDQLRAFTAKFVGHVTDLPITTRGTSHRVAQDKYKKGLAVVAKLDLLCDVVVAYQNLKRARHLIEFGDQIASAHQLVQIPAVREQIASAYQFVLLDEYQDTSSVQVALLSSVFAQRTVMAVGDPNQAIYGWRGASASNMLPHRFFEAFAGGQPGELRTLSRSWRNAQQILDVANLVARPLPRASSASEAQFELVAGKPHQGSVDVIFPSTITEEAADVASWFRRKFAEWPAGDKRPTAAMLTRKTADLMHFKLALDHAGIATHVLGLGGLLMEPVIVDIVSTLRVMHDTRADSQLIRLLAGARWQIAARDLRALKSTARWLSDRDHRLQRLSKEVRTQLKESVSASDGQSLIDALDFITTATDPTHRAFASLSATGFERLQHAGRVIARLRRYAGMNLRDLVRLVMAEMNLDVELAANDRLTAGEASVETFLDTVSAFMATDDNPTLGAFLSWIEDVERRERLSPVEESPEGDVVQLLTIHGSKGLEWDFVAVGRMIADDKRTVTTNIEKWTDVGALPEQLRADKADLGTLWDFENAVDQLDLEDSYEAYLASARTRYEMGERRLAYVALTRSAQDLLLSGSWWASGKTQRSPSIYLAEISEAGFATSPLPEEPTETENPWDPRAATVVWPLPPLGAREPRVRAAAALVRSVTGTQRATLPGEMSQLESDIELLIAERRARLTADARVPLPQRIPASAFKDYVAAGVAARSGTDSGPPSVLTSAPDSAASAAPPVAGPLGRPMPQQPYRATMLGTLFHTWVENRALRQDAPTLFDGSDIDAVEFPGAHDFAADAIDASDTAALAALQRTFEASPWGARQPVDVETEIHLPLGPNVVVCKLDAVYRADGADANAERNADSRFEIVDWKTGKAPRDAADLAVRAYQLALYRAAYASYTGIAEENIDAVFYFVADNVVVRPERLLTYGELEELWLGLLSSEAPDEPISVPEA